VGALFIESDFRHRFIADGTILVTCALARKVVLGSLIFV
jgi:hypothetical protein